MKRTGLVLVLSIVCSLLPSVIFANNVKLSTTNSVSLLALDANNVVQQKNGGVTTLLHKEGKNVRKQAAPQKVIAPRVEEKTTTQQITKSAAEAKVLKKATLPNMVKAWGYNWKTDRKKLANEVGIEHYVGTMKQNTQIKHFLLSKLQITKKAVVGAQEEEKSDSSSTFNVPDIQVTPDQIKAFTKLPIHRTVKFRGYIWEVDREKIANEVGIKKYIGSKEQNLLIKKFLKKKMIKKA